MSFWGDITNGGFLGGGAGMLMASKRDANGQLQQQIDQNQMARPAALDPSQRFSHLNDVDNRLKNYSASPWLNMQTQKQNMMTSQANDQAQAQGAGSAAQARSNLALHGGMSGGSAERLARGAAFDATQATQANQQQSQINQASLGAQDYQNHLADTNIYAGMAAKDDQAANDMLNNNYSEQMKAWASNQAANASLQANKKTGMFGLGIGGIL